MASARLGRPSAPPRLASCTATGAHGPGAASRDLVGRGAWEGKRYVRGSPHVVVAGPKSGRGGGDPERERGKTARRGPDGRRGCDPDACGRVGAGSYLSTRVSVPGLPERAGRDPLGGSPYPARPEAHVDNHTLLPFGLDGTNAFCI